MLAQDCFMNVFSLLNTVNDALKQHKRDKPPIPRPQSGIRRSSSTTNNLGTSPALSASATPKQQTSTSNLACETPKRADRRPVPKKVKRTQTMGVK